MTETELDKLSKNQIRKIKNVVKAVTEKTEKEKYLETVLLAQFHVNKAPKRKNEDNQGYEQKEEAAIFLP